MDHHLESTCQSPEQFQYGNIERDAGDRQPHTRSPFPNSLIHPHKKIDDISVAYHDTFRLPSRTRSVNDISQIAGINLYGGITQRFSFKFLLPIKIKDRR